MADFQGEPAIVREVQDAQGRHRGWAIFCPGCRSAHIFDQRWTFNNNMERPTFRSSMLVNKDDPKTRCHSHVRDGKIIFLKDCGHELKGQTVPLETF